MVYFLTGTELEEIESFYAESDMIQKMINNAEELSLEQSDSTI